MTLHEQHQALLEEHKQTKLARRENHKKNGGCKFRYPENLF